MQQQFGMCHSPTNKLASIQSPTINQGLPYGLYVTRCMQGNFTWDLSSECIFFQKSLCVQQNHQCQTVRIQIKFRA